MTKVSGLGVTVTLIFACEAHREAWLEQEGIIAKELPPTNEAGEYMMNEPDREKRYATGRRIDYEERKGNTDLQYVVGLVEKIHS